VLVLIEVKDELRGEIVDTCVPERVLDCVKVRSGQLNVSFQENMSSVPHTQRFLGESLEGFPCSVLQDKGGNSHVVA